MDKQISDDSLEMISAGVGKGRISDIGKGVLCAAASVFCILEISLYFSNTKSINYKYNNNLLLAEMAVATLALPCAVFATYKYFKSFLAVKHKNALESR